MTTTTGVGTRVAADLIPGDFLLTMRELRYPAPLEPDVCTGQPHAHALHVVFWPMRGSSFVDVAGQRHHLTLGQGVFVPAGTVHVVDPDPATSLTAVYIRTDAWGGDCDRVWGVTVNAAARELLVFMAYHGMPSDRRFRAQRLCLDLLAEPSLPSLELPLPGDGLIQPVARRILEHPEDSRSLEDWAWVLNTSGRTIARAFRADTGMTFSEWRTVARMSVAVRLLADGVAVGTVSRKVGYTSASAFSTALKRVTGRGPLQFRAVR